MAEIELTRGFVTLVDDEDHEMLSAWKWYAAPGTNTHYARRSGRRVPGQPRELVHMHRFILGLGPWQIGEPEVDHIDRDGLNNQRSNLRIVTHAQQAMNRDNGRLDDIECPTCGAVFHPWNRSSVYCSSSCFGRRPGNPLVQPRRLPDRICPECQLVFHPRNHLVKFCSNACRLVALHRVRWGSRRLGLR